MDYIVPPSLLSFFREDLITQIYTVQRFVAEAFKELRNALYIFWFPFQLAFFGNGTHNPADSDQLDSARQPRPTPAWLLSLRWPYLFHISAWISFNLVSFWIRLKSVKDLDQEMLNAMQKISLSDKLTAVSKKAWLILLPEIFLSIVS